LIVGRRGLSFFYHMKVVSQNPEVLGGALVFAGTRVPVESLFDHLEAGDSIYLRLTGKVPEELVVERIPNRVDRDAKLGEFLLVRLAQVERGDFSSKSVMEIWAKYRPDEDADFKKFSLESAMRGMEDEPDFYDETRGDRK
jgi:hypothetical protein